MTAATFPKVEKGKWKYTVTRLLYDTRSLVLLKRRSAKLEMCTAIINKPKKKKKAMDNKCTNKGDSHKRHSMRKEQKGTKNSWDK